MLDTLAQHFQQNFYPDMAVEDVRAHLDNPEVLNNAMAHIAENGHDDPQVLAAAIDHHVNSAPQMPKALADKYKKDMQEYKDSLAVYLQYKNKTQPKSEMILKDPKIQKEFDELSKKEDFLNNNRFKEEDALNNKVYLKYGMLPMDAVKKIREQNPNDPRLLKQKELFKKYENQILDETLSNVKSLEAKYKPFTKPIRDRINYIDDTLREPNVEQNSYNFSKPDPNFQVKGMKPVDWVKHDVNYIGGGEETYNGTYGESQQQLTRGNRSINTQTMYSPIFQKPTKPLPPQEYVTNTESPLHTNIVPTEQTVVEPVNKVVEKPIYTSPTVMYQGHQFMQMSKLQPGYYHPEEIDAINPEINKQLGMSPYKPTTTK